MRWPATDAAESAEIKLAVSIEVGTGARAAAMPQSDAACRYQIGGAIG